MTKEEETYRENILKTMLQQIGKKTIQALKLERGHGLIFDDSAEYPAALQLWLEGNLNYRTAGITISYTWADDYAAQVCWIDRNGNAESEKIETPLYFDDLAEFVQIAANNPAELKQYYICI